MKYKDDRRAEDGDLGSFVRAVWNGKWAVVLIVSACAAVGGAYAFLATAWWRADVVLVQVDSKAVPGGLAQLGVLGSLAGLNIGTGGASQTPVAVLKSKDFARDFIESKGLIPVLLADRWDSHKDWWPFGSSLYQPDIRDAVKAFDETVRGVSEDKKTGLITLSITWTDPNLAADWANELTTRINDRLRSQALLEAESSISFLRGEITATNIATLQQSLGKVLESEMQKLLLARGNSDYAFKVIDRAFPPRARSRPIRSVVMLMSVLLGFLLSAAYIFLVSSKRRD